MTYDFETVHKRYHTGSHKWDEMLAHGVREDEDIIPFSVADMEFVTAPEIVGALKRELDGSIMGYGGPTESYFDSVCDWIGRRHGWRPEPDWILPSFGVVDAFYQAVKTYTQKGDGVMLMTPVYYPMYRAILDNGRVLVDCPLIRTEDSYAIDFDDFEAKAADPNTKMLILCSPHNPCGRVWTREELGRIAGICLRHHLLVVSDEIHFDLIMPGYRHTVFPSISEEAANHCILCTAPSKTFNVAGLQTSNIIIPNPDLRKAFWEALKQSIPHPRCNILGYRACEAAYRSGEAWLEQAIGVIDSNRRLVIDYLNRELPQVKAARMEGTYLLWLDWRSLNLPAAKLEQINHEARLFFDEGYIFGEAGSGYERWNLACPSRYIQAALERMKAAYAPYLA